MTLMKNYNRAGVVLVVLSGAILSGCTSTKPINAGVSVSESFLADNSTLAAGNDAPIQNQSSSLKQSGFVKLEQAVSSDIRKFEIDLAARFSASKQLQMSVNELPLNEFIHYVLGELLKVSYVVDPTVKSNTSPVTVALQSSVSEQRLFQLSQDILTKNNVRIALNNDIFYIYPATKTQNKSDMAFGFGRDSESVPIVSGNIIQMIPMNYDVSYGTRALLGSLIDAEANVDLTQNLVTVKGTREQVIRALEIIEIIDAPTFANKSIAMVGFEYIDTTFFTEKVSELLQEEGISTVASQGQSSSVTFVPLEHLGKVVVFASSDKILERIKYWSQILDKPATGSEQSFFIYRPQFARASDIGKSLAPLLKGSLSGGNSTQSSDIAPSGNRPDTAIQRGEATSMSVDADGIRLVVDERANALIFYSTGQYYQDLQPIIRQLDIMPQQIMMEVVIAEVKLTGSFAKGVQYALKSSGSSQKSANFNFNKTDGFNYSVVGLPGSVALNLNQTDGLVNVLSRPTLLVRDGVEATISVGDDIPTIGSTTSDPINGERQTTTIQYRKTGVELSVTPTINAQGTVIMTVEQQISNINEEAGGATGTPAILERKISTEVVAGNGQTVLLGGLISQNSSKGATTVPLLGEMPILGHLFRSDSSSTDKTELVVLVTPKIVKNTDEWLKIKESFKARLENLKF